MANEISIKFGSFELSSTNGISVSMVEPSKNIDYQSSKIPMADHSISEEARPKEIIIEMEGSIVGVDYDDLRSKIDALKAAMSGGKKAFTLDDDRMIMAQCKSISCPFSTLRTIAKWKLTFVSDDPFWYSQTLNEASGVLVSGVGYTVTNNGNAPARIKVDVYAPAGGITDNCKLENQTNGESFQYRGTIAAGKYLVVDNRVSSNDFSVLNDGVSDMANFEGDFLTLEPGDNTVVYTGTAGAIIILRHRDCWH